MTKLLTAAVLAVLLAFPAAARNGQSQLQQNVARDLPRFGFNVDVSTLSTNQLAALYGIMHRSRASESRKRRMIRSILGGQYALRGLFF